MHCSPFICIVAAADEEEIGGTARPEAQILEHGRFLRERCADRDGGVSVDTPCGEGLSRVMELPDAGKASFVSWS